MKLPVLSVLNLVLLYALNTNAVKFKTVGRRTKPVGLARRGNLAGSSPLTDNADISYYTNITMGGKSFNVLIDTGSADLWVAGTVPNAQDSGKTSGVHYAIGAVNGPIKFAPMDFAGFTVQDQAYLEVTPDSTNPEGTGLIGLGPVTGSNVYATLKTTKGASALDRIFMQDTSTPNYLTVLLGRNGDPTDIFAGDLSIGEPLDNFTSILQQPKLEVTIVPVREAGDQHFQLLLDADGIIGPDGNSIPVSTEVDETSNKKQATAIVDTGFSLSQVPKSVADAIYGRVNGAEYVNVSSVGATWIVPCNQEVNLTFKISGNRYPVHPLDTTLNPSVLGLANIRNSQGQDSCIGMFQPMSFDTGDDPSFDIILGMSFIRNVYALFNFGDFIAGSTANRGDPYLQFLSTTDPSEAHSDFVQVRLNGIDTTSTQTLKSIPSSSSGPSQSGWRPPTLWLIIGAVGLGLALVVLLVTVLFCVRRRRNARKGHTSWGAYQQIDSQKFQTPANNHMYNATPAGYNPQQGQAVYDTHTHQKYAGYENPWDHRY